MSHSTLRTYRLMSKQYALAWHVHTILHEPCRRHDRCIPRATTVAPSETWCHIRIPRSMHESPRDRGPHGPCNGTWRQRPMQHVPCPHNGQGPTMAHACHINQHRFNHSMQKHGCPLLRQRWQVRFCPCQQRSQRHASQSNVVQEVHTVSTPVTCNDTLHHGPSVLVPIRAMQKTPTQQHRQPKRGGRVHSDV